MSELRFPRVNSIVLSGRLTRDPELRYIPNGTPMISLPIAFDRAYQKNGEWVQDVSYANVVVWSKRAEQCAQELKKGSPILVEGYLNVRNYVNKDNVGQKSVEIVSNKISFLEKDENALNRDGHTQASGEPYVEPERFEGNVADDDVPF